MFTASHNPAQYNGIKMCRASAVAIGQDTGLTEIRDRAEPSTSTAGLPAAAVPGQRRAGRPARRLRRVPARARRPVRHPAAQVVVDAGNGMGGYTVPAVLGDAVLPALPLTIVPLYFELDGSFPNHEANPLEPANIVDLQRRGRRRGRRPRASPSTATPTAASSSTPPARPSRRARSPRSSPPASWPRRRAATVIHNLITSHAVPEIVREHGGEPIRTRVGHSFIKAEMAARRTPCSAASTRRTTTSATSGSPTPACSPRCTCWPRWASSRGTLADAHRASSPATSRPARSTRRSTTRPRASPRCAPRSPAAPASIDELDGLTVELPDGTLVQRPRVQHRTAAAAQRRGADPTRRWRRSATTPSPPSAADRRRSRHADRRRAAGDARLPERRPRAAAGGHARRRRRAGVHVLPVQLPDRGRHPGAAARRGDARPQRAWATRPT